MAGIFISYRRQDSDHALSLYLGLLKTYGRASIFWDRKDIEPGRDFLQVIEHRIDASAALIALIGPGWLDATDEHGQRRLDRSDDVLRHEIAMALRKGILVLPVLGSGGAMPQASELPDEIAALSTRQALRMTDMQFHALLEESLATAGLSSGSAATEPQRSREQVARRAGDLLRRQTNRLQVRAKELMREGKSDRVTAELSEGVELLMALLDLLPGEEGMDLELGYLYAAYGRLFLDAGDRRQADRYLDLAMPIFQRIDAELTAVPESTSARASAVKGIGEIHYNRGEPHEAIRRYRAALDLEPAYSYAWHDLFGAYEMLARRDEIDLPAMRAALEGTRLASGTGAATAQPGLDRQYLADMERRLQHWEQVAARHPDRAAGAEDRCTAAIAEQPDDPLRHLQRAGLHFAKQRYEQAERDFTSAIGLGHKDADVHLYRARTRLALHDADGAAADCEAAIALGHRDGYFYRGLAHTLRPDLAAAESDFTTAIDLDACKPEAFRWRGMLRAQSGDATRAAADFEAAIALGRRDADMLYELGQQRMAVEDAAGAEQAYSTAIELGRDDALVYVGRAMARASRGDGAAAAADFQGAIDRGAAQPFLHYMLGKVRSWQGDAAGAEAGATAAISAGYLEGAAFRVRAIARADQQNHAGAIADYDEAIARGEDDAGVYLKRAMSRLMQMDAAGAEADFTTAMERGAQGGVAHYGRALARRFRGDVAGTFADCTAAIDGGGADPGIYRLRAHAAARLGHLAIAEADCAALDALVPGDAESHGCKGDLHLARGEYYRAAEDYRARLAAAPDRQASLALGLALRLSGRGEEADAVYQEAVEAADPSEIAIAVSDLALWTKQRPDIAATTAAVQATLEARLAAAGRSAVAARS